MGPISVLGSIRRNKYGACRAVGFGDKISYLLLGGNIVGENALVRFYVLHCFILPVSAVMLMGVHFWRVRKDGGV